MRGVVVDREAERQVLAARGSVPETGLGQALLAVLEEKHGIEYMMTTQRRHGKTEHVVSILDDMDATGETTAVDRDLDRAAMSAGVLWLVRRGMATEEE